MKAKQLKSDFLYKLFERISAKIGKPLEQMKPYYQILKDNWYDNEKALKEISDDEYIKLKIPVRLIKAIKQEIGTKNDQRSILNELPLIKDFFDFFERCCSAQNKIVGESVTGIQWNGPQLNQYVVQLQKDLRLKFKQNPNEILIIFESLQQIIHKIVQDPFEIQFRTLNKSNLKINKIVTINTPVVKFLTQIGFKYDSEKYFLPVPKIDQLNFIQDALSLQIKKQKQENVKNIKKVEEKVKMPSNSIPITEKAHNVEGMKSFENQFNLEKLAEMQYAESLDKLLKFRQNMMSQTPKNRQIKIYHKDYEKKHTNEFAEVSAEEVLQKSEEKLVRDYWKKIMTENQKNSQLQSKRKKEFEFLVRQKIYNQTTIKIRLPNDFVIEAKFGSMQKLSDVFKLISTIVIGSFFLYSTPPVKRLEKEMDKTLYELQSVPTGNFFLGINGEWRIADQFIKIVEK